MKSLRILGLDITLRVLDPDSGTLGEWHDAESKLSLSACLTPSRRSEILWHEILHAISDRLALDLSEKEVQRIAAAQYAVLRENPELLELLGR